MQVCGDISPTMRVDLVQPFYDDPAYIDALVASAKPFLGDGFHRLLLSYHGVPERHIRKTDPSHAHCLCTRECCRSDHPAHATCYRHQCLRTAELFVRRAGIDGAQCAIAFQSRFGGDSWLGPATMDVIRNFGRDRVGTLLVMTPGFVTDCLETLDEIGDEGRRIFHDEGGGEMVLVPCLNDHPLFLDCLATRIHQWQDALPDS
jgi:ferrochelatase